jgi:hypothetical protein
MLQMAAAILLAEMLVSTRMLTHGGSVSNLSRHAVNMRVDVNDLGIEMERDSLILRKY